MNFFLRQTVIASLSLFSVSAFGASFTVDKAHSRVGFSIRHLVSKVQGEFRDFSATFEYDPAKQTFGEGKFEVKTASINTANDKRDDHLRSPDFFDAKKFPTITVTSGKVTTVSKDKFQWVTDLTMHGVTKPVTFEVAQLGIGKGPDGNNRAGFEATGRINRKDFGITWNKMLDAGGAVLGEDVDITITVESIEQSKEAKKN